MKSEWQLPGAVRDRQSITSDWMPTGLSLLDGVVLREARNVVKANGRLTELFRRDWFAGDEVVDQVFQVVLHPGGVSAWHAHDSTTDRLFVTEGSMKLVLYDGRSDSGTHRQINELHLSIHRPTLVVVPPGVWHGVQNTGTEPAALLNMVDRAYQYDNPDHWRLPPDTEEIPYQFHRATDALA
ncbi:cupin domain-containing protein [Thioalkalivibrio thiocyanodenitrificans]|uniref:cupin domain-containing protein n=1 Tax=Thioalkalivibrio thiocyanodenitrificans TaxID=243063 RepID=UPI0006872C43|nr:cupin domain-containing protein [Thioalkalivibrio thiocyanodenitrificans]